MRTGTVRAGILVTAVAIAVVVPSLAHAATFCVHKSGCAGTAEPTVAAALNSAAAAPGGDRVLVGRGTYAEDPLTIDDPHALSLVGSGASNTTLTLAEPAAQPPNPVLTVLSAGAKVRRLGVTIPADGGLGLDLRDGIASSIHVTGARGLVDGFGVRLLGTSGSTPSLRSSRVRIPLGSDGLGVAGFAGATVSASTVTAPQGVRLSDATMSRVSVTSNVTGVVASHSLVEDSTVQATGTAPSSFVGLDARALIGDDSVIANELSLRGSGAGIGVRAEGVCDPIFKQADDMSLLVVNVAIDGFATDLAREGTTGPTGCGVAGGPPAAQGNLSVSYSLFDPALVTEAGAGTLTVGSGNVSADPAWIDPAAGDLRPSPGSPLIDAGSPNGIGSRESPVDLAGNPRIADGDGDGTARRDIGAFELQP